MTTVAPEQRRRVHLAAGTPYGDPALEVVDVGVAERPAQAVHQWRACFVGSGLVEAQAAVPALRAVLDGLFAFPVAYAVGFVTAVGAEIFHRSS
jgi:hypothetical protein